MTKEEFKGRLLYLEKMRENLKKQKEALESLMNSIGSCIYETKEKYCDNKHDWQKYGDYYSKWRICKKCGLEV